MKNIEIQKRKKMETYGLKVFMCKNQNEYIITNKFRFKALQKKEKDFYLNDSNTKYKNTVIGTLDDDFTVLDVCIYNTSSRKLNMYFDALKPVIENVIKLDNELWFKTDIKNIEKLKPILNFVESRKLSDNQRINLLNRFN